MDNFKEEVRVWIKALRSGKYKQTTGQLQDNHGYCCLGVACEVLIPQEEQTRNDEGNLYGYTPTKQSKAPAWLKEIDDDFEVINGKSLTVLNDKELYSFGRIADLLQSVYLPGEDVL